MKNILKTILFILILFTSVITVKGNSYNMLKKLYIVEGSYDTLFYPGFQLIMIKKVFILQLILKILLIENL